MYRVISQRRRRWPPPRQRRGFCLIHPSILSLSLSPSPNHSWFVTILFIHIFFGIYFIPVGIMQMIFIHPTPTPLQRPSHLPPPPSLTTSTHLPAFNINKRKQNQLINEPLRGKQKQKKKEPQYQLIYLLVFFSNNKKKFSEELKLCFGPIQILNFNLERKTKFFHPY